MVEAPRRVRATVTAVMGVVCTMKQRKSSRSGVTERASQRVFFVVSALLFVVSAALTIHWCTGMSMGEMPMPGGWTMSMTWMPMCGQGWLDAAASFLAMWVAMMVAMMLPSLTPTLWRYYQVAGNPLTIVAGLGYFFVWTLIGMVAFPIGVALTTMEMQSPALASGVPFVAALVVLSAGALQFTAWKAAQLDCCRATPRCHLRPANIVAAWRYGLRLGFRCSYCCAGLTATLFVIGVMDLRAMAVVTVAITVERLAPTARAARIIGVVVVAAGLLMFARAAVFV